MPAIAEAEEYMRKFLMDKAGDMELKHMLI